MAAAEAARTAAETARSLLAHGAALYAQGDLAPARLAFERAATSTGDEALEFRAQACYDLGLTCWRLGQADAALAAFDACEKALRYGSSPRRFPDETVSPAFGRALVALGTDNASALRTSLAEARRRLPASPTTTTWPASWRPAEKNAAVAVRAFERALRRADRYPEIDGWMARTRLDLGRQALAAGTPTEEATPDFEAAVAFAQRASAVEEAADKTAFRALLRECWIRIADAPEPARRRFEGAPRGRRTPCSCGSTASSRPASRSAGTATTASRSSGRPTRRAGIPTTPASATCSPVLNKVPPGRRGPVARLARLRRGGAGRGQALAGLEEKVVAFEAAGFRPAGGQRAGRSPGADRGRASCR